MKSRNRRIRIGEDHRISDQYIPTIMFSLRNRRSEGLDPPLANCFSAKTYTNQETGDGMNPGTRNWITIKDSRQQKDSKLQSEIRAVSEENCPSVNKNKVVPLAIGTSVYVRTHPLSEANLHFCAGFAPKCNGPYPIIDQQEELYLLEIGKREPQKVYKNHVRETPDSTHKGDLQTKKYLLPH
ncbi:hypothetical protein PR048_027773 [Dryococelus australis]|uniref:Uncharacterized protein n=1 Tax=Dryococelus australis TaxID=614101 RepID=A0ABQ9GHF3_9NEOP|nr:hypothetical protein PR048_027773 [Dryococelus australis]